MTPRPSRRAQAEKVEGIVFDCLLAAAVVMVSSDEVQAWLLVHPRELYYGVSALHVITVPAILIAVVSGYGRSEEAVRQPGIGVIGWAVALFLCCSFIVPGVLGLAVDSQLWVLMATVFGPFVGIGVGMFALVLAEKRGWIAPTRVGERKAWWKVQLLALLAWGYLLWMETLMLVAAAKGGPLAEVGLPLGVLVDYVPVRVMLYYVREASRWEIATIVASTLHLIVRISTA